MVGLASVLNLTVPGCLVETGLHLKPGQSLQIKIMLPGGKSLACTLAVVRWVNGRRAGVEFIRMSEEDQARLRWQVGFQDKRRATTTWSEHVMWTGIAGV
jgi:hypothetical protein